MNNCLLLVLVVGNEDQFWRPKRTALGADCVNFQSDIGACLYCIPNLSILKQTGFSSNEISVCDGGSGRPIAGIIIVG